VREVVGVERVLGVRVQRGGCDRGGGGRRDQRLFKCLLVEFTVVPSVIPSIAELRSTPTTLLITAALSIPIPFQPITVS
jgi:hypothetical protein